MPAKETEVVNAKAYSVMRVALTVAIPLVFFGGTVMLWAMSLQRTAVEEAKSYTNEQLGPIREDVKGIRQELKELNNYMRDWLAHEKQKDK